MSIKGFIINGQTVKYNYPDLDNLPSEPSGGGVTEALKTALLQFAQKVAYIDANGQNYYQDLYDALYGSVTTYTISNSLTAVVNSNAATTIAEGSSYTATLSCAADYEITSVSVTMGGTDVTNTAYSSGTISIANVTGNIVIIAVATQRVATLSSIDAVFSQGQTVIYNTDSLDTLKQYLIVTANWDDSTTSTVASSDYTLSGTLTVGTSTITVSYGGKTDTFSVTVTEAPLYPISNGTHTFTGTGYTGRTVTVTNGNHVSYHNENSTSVAEGVGTYAIFDTLSSNTASADTANINSPTATLFTLPNASSVVMAISNIQCSSKGGVAAIQKFAMALRSGSTSVVTTGDLSPTDTSKTVTATISGAKNITCAFLYSGVAITDLEFDISVTVDGEKWI